MVSVGKARCTAPGRPLVAMRKARRTVSGIFSAVLRKEENLVTGSNSLWCSISVMVPLPSPASDTPEVNRITGIDEALASATPGTE